MIEAADVTTVSFSLNRRQSEAVRPPRTLVVHYPFGHPLGQPGAIRQQRQLLFDCLQLALTADAPGMIRALPYRWRRHRFERVDFGALHADH